MFRSPTITRSALTIAHRSLWLVLFAGVTVLANASTAQATTLYVNAICGDDAKAGTSPNCADANGPKRTIQNAINTAIDTDEIEVAPGTYNEVIDFIGKAITLRSTDPSDPAVVAATIIDGTGLYNSVVKCISGEGADTVLSGFTITGGTGSTYFGSFTGGGGMYNSASSPVVTDCTFASNAGDYGAGMINKDNSSPSMTRCVFTENVADGYGGGMHNSSSSPMVTNCTFTGNAARYGGGGMYSYNSSPVLTNCIFTRNRDTRIGGGMFNNSSGATTLINCTFSGNKANDKGGAMYNLESNPTVINSVLWGNFPQEMANSLSSPTITYSDVRGGHAGIGNIDRDPKFVDAHIGDWRLRSESPCIDSGANDSVSQEGNTDLNGDPRFADHVCADDSGFGLVPIVDMGAYEFQDQAACGNGVCEAEETCETCACDCGECCGNGICANLEDCLSCADDCACETIYVPGDYDRIQDAIDASYNGDAIEVAPGTYNEVINFDGKAIMLHSTDPSDPAVVAATIIDGTGLNSSVVKCVSDEGVDTVLDGFTIIGGTGSACVSNSSACGGGMYNDGSSPTVSNCTFTGNAGDYGAGMYNYNSNPTVSDCTFRANTAGSGGGMSNYEYSAPRVINCAFLGNSVRSRGGGVHSVSHSSPRLFNCIFSGNTAYRGSTLYSYYSTPMVTNCTFTANVAGNGGAMYNIGSPPI